MNKIELSWKKISREIQKCGEYADHRIPSMEEIQRLWNILTE